MLFFPDSARGQIAYPKAEVFGGVSIASLDLEVSRESFWGWEASVAGNFHKNVGLVADFGGQYKSIAGTRVQLYEYLFGPKLSLRGKKFTAFHHSLFGGAHISGGGESDNAFMIGTGVGIDLDASDRLAFRLVQFDFIPHRSGGEWSTRDFRVAFGIVLKARR